MPFLQLFLLVLLATAPLFAADNEASIVSALMRITHHLPSLFQGRGLHKAAFLVFATPTDVRSPAETIERYKILRERGVPIDGFFLEAEHTGLNPESARFFVTLAEANSFRVMVRPPSLSADSVKSWNSLGHSGLIVPLTNDKETIKAGFAANFYGKGRPIGYELDTRMLTAGSARELEAIDRRRTLAFMIEDTLAVENIDELVESAVKQAKKDDIKPKHIAFWLGPYDMEADVRLQHKDWDATKVTDYVSKAKIKVAKAVTAAGLTMAGNVGDGKVALERLAQGWTAFTIDGMYTEDLSDARSVRQRFGTEAGQAFLEAINQPRKYKKKEYAVVQELLGALAAKFGCGVTFGSGKDAMGATTGEDEE